MIYDICIVPKVNSMSETAREESASNRHVTIRSPQRDVPTDTNQTDSDDDNITTAATNKTAGPAFRWDLILLFILVKSLRGRCL